MTDTNEDTTVYWEVTVIIDGAVDACHEWDDTECDDLWLSDWMDAEEWSIQQECPDVDYDIYVLFHDHPPMDCECIQFEQSHHPERSNR